MSMASGRRRRVLPRVLALEVVLAVVVVIAGLSVPRPTGPYSTTMDGVPPLPPPPAPAAGASTGSFTWDCGRNEEGHLNTANVVVTPRAPGPAHHVHDYV